MSLQNQSKLPSGSYSVANFQVLSKGKGSQHIRLHRAPICKLFKKCKKAVKKCQGLKIGDRQVVLRSAGKL